LHGMQEVGGSIPPGSTILRSLRELRLDEPHQPILVENDRTSLRSQR
jgi:hypothetical protein